MFSCSTLHISAELIVWASSSWFETATINLTAGERGRIVPFLDLSWPTFSGRWPSILWLEAERSLHQTLFFLLFGVLPPPLLQASFQTLIFLQCSVQERREGSQAVYTYGVAMHFPSSVHFGHTWFPFTSHCGLYSAVFPAYLQWFCEVASNVEMSEVAGVLYLNCFCCTADLSTQHMVLG